MGKFLVKAFYFSLLWSTGYSLMASDEVPEIEILGVPFFVQYSHAIEQYGTFGAKKEGMSQGEKHTEIIYQQTRPDGMPWRRNEVYQDGKLFKIIIINDDGAFDILGSNVISDPVPMASLNAVPPPQPVKTLKKIDKNTFKRDGEIITRSGNPEKFRMWDNFYEACKKGAFRDPNYQYSETTYQGRPCYKIREYNPRTGGACEYIIDRERYFPYVTRQYDCRGKLESESIYQDVDFNPDFKPSLFQFPDKSKVYIATNPQQQVYLNMNAVAADIDARRQAEYKAQVQRTVWRNRWQRAFTDFGSFLLRHGGKIFGSIAVLAIAILIWHRFKVMKGGIL